MSGTAGTGGLQVLLRGGMIVDGSGEREGDVLVEGRTIIAVGTGLVHASGARVLDCAGCVVSPGFVDIHTHLREPGAEGAETVIAGSRAAALGGYTAVVAMPNTDPPADSAAVVRDVLALGEKALCQVAVAGTITVGRQGERLAPIGEMRELGVRLFTDDGRGVQDAGVMRRALEYAAGLGVTIADHCEVEELSAGGSMNEGRTSSLLGITGIPAEAEEIMVARDIALARRAGEGARLHLMHLSCAGSVSLVAAAKREGLNVSAEVTPHHIMLTEALLTGFDPVFKVSPPLRDERDVMALREGIAAGVIDAIATDHAPHPAEDKEMPLPDAPPGMIGLETALPVAIEALVKGTRPYGTENGDTCGESGSGADRGDGGGSVIAALTSDALVALLSRNPAKIAGLDVASEGRQGGVIEQGAPANIAVVDPAAEWTVEPGRMSSLSRNTGFAGRRMTGRVRHTIFEGEPVVIAGEAQR